MGGQAFNHPGPNGEDAVQTSRLTPQVYTTVKAKASTILSRYYERVICPREAPGKSDHGDVDFLVEGPRFAFTHTDVAADLQTCRTIDRGDTYSIAAPFRQDDGNITYAQLDVRVCSGNIDWLAFLQSYSDLWQILGLTLRGYGFTANEKGLHVRVEQIEEADWKASMVFLSKDPQAVLAFLGLDVDLYEQGFDKEKDFFQWLSNCRYVDKRVYLTRKGTADERRRLNTRGLFRRFVEDWAPTLPEHKRDSMPRDRLTVSCHAATYFKKEEDFRAKVTTAVHIKNEELAWQLISDQLKPFSLSKDKLNLVLRGFKRWVEFTNKMPCVRAEPEMRAEYQARFATMVDPSTAALRKGVGQWIGSHWEEIRTLENGRVKIAKATRATIQAAKAEGQ